MGSPRFTLVKLGLDAVTAFVPRRSYEAKAEAIALGTGDDAGRVDGGWQFRRIASRDGSYEHDYAFHPSKRHNAPTLILLHGLFLDGRSFFNLTDLASDFELVAYNYPQRWEGYSGQIDDFTGMLDDFTTVLGIDQFVLGGVSFGGMVALRYAATLPASKLQALILIATRVPGLTAEQRRQSIEFSDLLSRYADYRLVWLQEAFQRLYLGRFKGESKAQMSALLRPKDVNFYRQATRALRGFDGGEDARKITVPVLYLRGTKDTLIPPESADELLEVMPHAQVELVPDATHVMTTVNADEVSRRISSFLV